MNKRRAAATAAAGVMLLTRVPAIPALAVGPEPVLQFGHTYGVRALAFAASGNRLASSGDGLIKLWDARTGRLWRELRVGMFEAGSPSDASPVALSPDGQTVAHARARGVVDLWDARTGRRRRTLDAPADSPYSVLWTPDGRTFAVSGSHETWLWNAATWQRQRRLPTGGSIAFSADGRRMASAAMRNSDYPWSASLWDVPTGRRLRVFRDDSDVFGPVALSPDGRLVATAGEDPTWKEPETAPGQGAPTMASSAHDLKVKVWDARTGKRLSLLSGHGSINSGTTLLAFTLDGKGLVSSGDGRIDLWNPRTGQLRWRMDGLFGTVAAVSLDGRALAYATGYNRVALRSARTGKRLWLGPAAPLPVDALAFSSDGLRLAAADHTHFPRGTLRLWEARTGQLAMALPILSGGAHDLTFLDHGRTLASNQVNEVQLWDLQTRRPQRTLRGAVSAMAGSSEVLLSPDGRTLVIGHPDLSPFNLEVRDAATGRGLRTIEGFDHWLRSAVFSPDSRRLANEAGSRERGVGVWSLATGQREHFLTVPGGSAQHLVFSPDGKRLAGFCPRPPEVPLRERQPGQLRWEVRLWDLETGQLQWVAGVSDRVEALACSPERDLLAAGGTGRVWLLGIQDGRLIRSLEGHVGRVSALAFSPDGDRLASGGDDGSVRIWEARTGRLLVTMIGLPPDRQGFVSTGWIALTPSGDYDASPGAARFLRWRVGDRLLPAAAYASRYHRPEQVRKTLAHQ